MAQTFSQIKTGLDTISARIVADRALLVQAKSTAQSVAADLTSMGTEYTQFVQDVDAASAANPTDAAYTNAKAEKDRLVAEFNALKTVANNTVTAAAV